MKNEKRIYLMTQLAVFEEHHKDQLSGARTFFRSDYIGGAMIKNGIRITLAFLLALAGWGVYNAETLIVDITKIDVMALGSRILFLYAAIMCIFLVFTYAIQAVRYSRAMEDLYQYRELLKELELSYQMEDAEKRRKSGRNGE
ncbi:MAG: hypothetical protein Q4C50_08675 [Eubacteriales bacterium]|nr:hypothetical protein [Eubacteriales bacterium]